MHTPSVYALLLPLALSSVGAFVAAEELTLAVEPALAEIDPRPPGPRVVRLPDMAFSMRVAADCGEGMQAESASISIADTRLSLGPEAIADAAENELLIRTPRQQLAPITIENFCFTEPSPGDYEELIVADALSAQLALLCVGADQRTMIYRATPIAVTLRCKANDD